MLALDKISHYVRDLLVAVHIPQVEQLIESILPTFTSFKIFIVHGSCILSLLATHVHSHPLLISNQMLSYHLFLRLYDNLYDIGFWHSMVFG